MTIAMCPKLRICLQNEVRRLSLRKSKSQSGPALAWFRIPVLVLLTLLILSGIARGQSAGLYQDLHDFGGTATDGNYPDAGVTFDSAGNMYGTTFYGGLNGSGMGGSGMVWEITTSGTYKDLHDFGGTVVNADGTNGPDGAFPKAGVTFDSAGNMYSTTYNGGPNGPDMGGSGMVWEITTSGTYKDLHDFGGTVVNADRTNGPDGAFPLAGVTFDSAGNMYGTTSNGGPNGPDMGGSGMVWDITTSRTYKDLHDFGGTVVNADGTNGPDGANPCAGVTFDSAGNMYGTTFFFGPNGPNNGAGMVWEITASGAYEDLHDFGGTITNANGTSGPDGANTYAGVTFDGNGNMFGAASHSGADDFGMVWTIIRSSPPLTNISLSPTTVQGGASTTGTITLLQAAPADGATIALSTSSPNAVVPSSVNVASGGKTAVFEVATTAVNANTTVKITAGFGANSKSATLTLTPATLASMSLSPTTVVGGNNSTGTVNLSGPAGPGGTSVALSSSNSVAGVYSTAIVPAGQTSATFTITTSGVSTSASATISASLGATTKKQTLSVTPSALAGLSLAPTSVGGGFQSTGTALLNGFAPAGGLTVSLSSSATSVATVPASIQVPAGQSSATFAISTSVFTTQRSASIKAAYLSVSKSATLTVTPATVASVTLNPSTVAGGISTNGTVSLTSLAPTGGLVVKLASNSTSTSLPASVTIPAGASSAGFVVKTSYVSAQTLATITATLGSVSQTTSLTISPPALVSITFKPSSVLGGESATGTVTLSSPAPSNGIVIWLFSSKGANVPIYMFVGANKTSGTFTVRTAPEPIQTSATVTATLGTSSLAATLTILRT